MVVSSVVERIRYTDRFQIVWSQPFQHNLLFGLLVVRYLVCATLSIPKFLYQELFDDSCCSSLELVDIVLTVCKEHLQSPVLS